MQTHSTIASMRAACRAAKYGNQSLGFVPTMGALHEGHLSLMRAAKKECGVVAASIFVNPTQFGPNEDYSKYPRTLERDAALLEKENVDLLFTPSADEMYPKGATTFVEVGGLGERLCGRFRPGHFRGVATIVSKLFHIVEPDVAYFGQKDAAQCAIIKRMVRDLDMPVHIAVCPITREPDGLAMSSRNAYLTPEQRKQALVLSRALNRVQQSFHQGEKDSAKLIDTANSIFATEPTVQLEYVEIVDAESLEPVPLANKGTLVAVAAKVGGTRLIDNILLS